MDTKINTVKLGGKERHECNRDTYMCSFAPQLPTAYILRAAQDKRNAADLDASESRTRRKWALYEPPYVIIKRENPKTRLYGLSKGQHRKNLARLLNQPVVMTMMMLPLAEPQHPFTSIPVIAQKQTLLLEFPHQHNQITKVPIQKDLCSPPPLAMPPLQVNCCLLAAHMSPPLIPLTMIPLQVKCCLLAVPLSPPVLLLMMPPILISGQHCRKAPVW
jgi:hypothetical protein